MSRYAKPFLECISYKIEERLASECTGSCLESGGGYVLNPNTGKWEETHQVSLTYSN